MGHNNAGEMVKLGDTGKTVADPQEDIRGYTARDRSGEELGKVEELLIDQDEEKVRFLLIASGGFLGIGKDKTFLPVDAVQSINHSDREVLIGHTREQIAGAPDYDPDLAEVMPYFDSVYGYYGFSPYWSPGYGYPAYPYYPR